MTKLKKALSLCLALFISIGIVTASLDFAGVSVSAADYTSELWLVDSVNYALVRGERQALSHTADLSPYQVDSGTMYLPVSIICGFTGAQYSLEGDKLTVSIDTGRASLGIGSLKWERDGEAMSDLLLPPELKEGEPFLSILAANAVFGTYAYYDSSMGLLILSENPVSGYNSSYSSIVSQVKTLASLVMDRPTGTEILWDLDNHAGSDTHPRLLLDSQKFDSLRRAYAEGGRSDPYYEGVVTQLRVGTSCFNTYFTDGSGGVEWKSEEMRESVRQPHYLYDENGNRLIGKTSYTYIDEKTGESVTLTLSQGSGDGYDLGGRSSVETFTKKMQGLAFAWQITGEDKYADAFYLFAMELDKWEHWGEGHFLNVADGSYYYAIGFDWIYHAFDSEPEKREDMADILYRKGLMKGYYSIKFDGVGSMIKNLCDFSVSSRAGASGAWRTVNRDNNWQTVCGGGMIVTALALAEYDSYRDTCAYVMEKYVRSFEKCHWQFAPDGSYPESPGYWGYCVNTLMNTLVAFENCCGRSYGYKDVVGLYESFYYAMGISDSENRIWNYHDCSEGVIGASYFYLASTVFGDDNFAAYRNEMIFGRGAKMDLMDVIFYDPDFADAELNLPLDYNFKGVHTATMRSSFDEGGIYTGLHVGPAVHNHSDFDTGSFILNMGGIRWCADPGTENYNVNGFWDTAEGGKRYSLYRKSLEGHSAVLIHSDELVHGQKYVTNSGDFPTVDTFYSDIYGAFAVSDMSGQYGSSCREGYRGVLLTNSRRTVVLQDEISFSAPTTLSWILNITGTLKISSDGRSLTSTVWKNGEKNVLRLTLISEDESLSFRRLGKEETVLDSTVTATNSGQTLACDPEQRVVIEANDVTEFNVAVVFDLLRHEDEAVGYKYLPMAEWTTDDGQWLDEENSDIVYPEDKPVYKYKASHFASALSELDAAQGDFAKIGEILSRTAVYLTDCDMENPTVSELVKRYKQYLNRYNYEVEKVNSAFEDIFFGAIPSPKYRD